MTKFKVRIRNRADVAFWVVAATLAITVVVYMAERLILPLDIFERYIAQHLFITVLVTMPGAYWVCLQILKLYEAHQSIKQISSIDSLTGAANRRRFFEVQQRMAEAAASVIMIDVDRFKSINDTYGHPVGDEVLREIAAVLRGIVGEMGIVVRFGGEEFLIYCPDMDVPRAAELAERLRKAVSRQTFDMHDPGLSVTISLGLSLYRGDGEIGRALSEADGALYTAKSSGRDRVIHSTQPRLH